VSAFRDRSVLVTGASQGIGAELARQLARQGAWLTLAARDAHALDVVAQGCIAAGGRAVIHPTDVRDPAQCAAAVRHALASYGKLDVLVNNAGVSMWARVDEVTDLGIFERLMAVNYLGAVYCTHAALPALRASRGRIVVVSSLVGKTGVPTRSGYAASKHALHGFFDSLRIELHGTGVSVTLVCPGFVPSEIRSRAFTGDGRPLGAEPVAADRSMPVADCARQILVATEARRRELVMTGVGKVGAALKLLAPRVVDWLARRAIERSQAAGARRET
jgi:short-subunit dehydrogenase